LQIKSFIIFCLCSYSFNAVAESEFDAWKRGTLNEFSEYKSKQDKEFADFLKMNWIELNAFKGKPLYEEEKIVEPPVAPPVTPAKDLSDKKKASLEKPVIVKIPEKKTPPKKQVSKPEPVLTPVKGRSININFFGNMLALPYDKAMQKRIRGKINKETISGQWSKLAKSDYEPLIAQLHTYQKQLKLNDWAYALLVNYTAKELYPNQKNEQVLFSWFALVKSGYKSRLAYKGRSIFLLLATKQQIYAAQSLKYKGTKYYILGFDGNKQAKLAEIYTYDGDYPDSKQLFDMSLQQAIVTGKNETKRNLEFSFSQKKYMLKTVSNKHMVDFMSTYPQVHWNTYFNSNPDTLPRQQVADQLRPNLVGLSEQEAVNFLLRFVQTSLTYATDDKQFGYEKPLFPEESLFYPASDCEDRAFLFAWLVQDLLGLDVVGLLYPGHMATAVRLNMKVNGDTFVYKGKNYLVADPTYINANIGNAMPNFKKSKPEFIEINKI
ncbi:MAG: hypothetical protein OEM38_07720, partial [Gammaproteobacteria bacterium]|nr:hypothetical protein [Gammaproteobacteria bacterium]